MIWNFLKKNRVLGFLSCLILSLVCVCLFGISRSYALSTVTANEFYVRYTDNWTSSEGTWGNSTTRGLAQFPSFINSTNGVPDTSQSSWLAWNVPYPYGYSRLYFNTNNIIFSQNNMVLHAEYNFVVGNRGTQSYFMMPSASQLDFHIDSCNYDIASENVSYHVTDWDRTLSLQGNDYYYTFKTVTFYIDLVLKNLPSGSHAVTCNVFGGNNAQIGHGAFMLNGGPYNGFAFNEKFEASAEFYSSINDAIQTATNEALQQQTLIMQWQQEHAQELAEQDARDRAAVQDVSDDASSDGDSYSSSTQSASSSLLSGITNIYNTLLHPSTSNCLVGPINFYGQLNLGTLDFCTFNTPTQFFQIGSLISIGLILALAWSVIHTAMGLYKDLFGGKE